MKSHTEVKVNKLPRCDFYSEGFCRNFGEAHYDGKTIHGPWANMCEQHFSAYGVGLGLGRGQKLILKEEMR